MDTFQVGTICFMCSFETINCMTHFLLFLFSPFACFLSLCGLRLRMGGEGVNAKSFSGQVMLIQQLWDSPLIQMLCKELAQGPKHMHLYSLQPRARTNEQLGNFKQPSLSFLSQGKCTYKIAAFQLIKLICSYMPSPRLSHLASPQWNQTIKDWIQIYSPSLHIFHPADCVSEGDVLPLSSKSLITMH